MYRGSINVLLYLFFLLLLSLLNGKDHKHKSQVSVTRQRLIKELRDIGIQELLPCFPFNTTADEIGVRLQPTENLLEWHFSFTGIESSNYEKGIYHGRIILPKDYPRKAPMIAVMTPNGRWEVGKPICLSATGYHQETWDPSWNLRTLVMALRGHMLTYPREIGGIHSTVEKKSLLADASRYYFCSDCGMKHNDMLKPLDEEIIQSLREDGSKRQVELLLKRSFTRKKQRNGNSGSGNVHSNKKGGILNEHKDTRMKSAKDYRQIIDSSSRSSSKDGGESDTIDHDKNENVIISTGQSRSLGIKEIVKLLSPIIVAGVAFVISFTYYSFVSIGDGEDNDRRGNHAKIVLGLFS